MTISSAERQPEPPAYASDLAEEVAEPETGAGYDETHPSELPADRFLDRQLSWLDFNERVLELAADPDVPLLERVRFLAIFSGNLDEFFMVRVAGLKRRLATGVAVTASSGLTPKDRLAKVSRRAHDLVEEQYRLFRDEISPALSAAGIQLTSWDELDPAECASMKQLFEERIYPVLTPLAVDPAHPFPYISGLSLNLAVVVRDRDNGKEHFARVKVPPLLPRFLPVRDECFIPIEQVIAAHLPDLFPGMDVVETSSFRVTRNEDVDVEEEQDVENLLAALERELVRRRFGPPVRLELESNTSERVRDLLVRELDVVDSDVYCMPAPLDLAGLWGVTGVERPEIAYPSFVTRTNPLLQPDEGGRQDLFAVLRSGDVLLHHPYDSFTTSVLAFVEQAASDPGVLAIKQTLYRTSGDSPIVEALAEAARAGKQVLVVVEIKARFDEQANIRWARALEQAGCHVVYGLIGLKTHCKLSLVVRQETDGSLRRYAHLGTGNYNPKTARQYEDFGLLTAHPQVCEDVADLFNHLSGYTKHRGYETLLVAPDSMRAGILELIEQERQHALDGRPAAIRLKVNSLVDEEVIDALYRASQAGVPVSAVVRGMCSLRPAVPGLSENIVVRSVLGRFLEHSRVLHFGVGDRQSLWLGSADMMHRNLDRRVEAFVRVQDPHAAERLAVTLDRALSPLVAAWELQADGRWVRRHRADDGSPLRDLQEQLLLEAAGRPVAPPDVE